MRDEGSGFSPARRRFLGAAALASVSAASGSRALAPGAQASAPVARPIDQLPMGLRDPRERLENWLRVELSLDESDVIWWYAVSWSLLLPEHSPTPLLRYDAMEMARQRRVASDRYIVHGHHLAFARDPLGGKYIREIRNPFTGEALAVRDLEFSDLPGYELAAHGLRSLGRTQWQAHADHWSRDNAQLQLQCTRGAPLEWRGQFIEQHTTIVTLQDYWDLMQARLPARRFGHWLQPAPKWLAIPEARVLAQFVGRKLASLAELPQPYYQRLERDYPHLMQISESKF